MANYCSYWMKACGKKKDCLKLLEVMQRDYKGTADDQPHLWRVFEAGSTKETDNSIEISGYCAWSVKSCMFDGDGTYQSDDSTGKGTTIDKLSKELNLDIEIFSEEPGMEFAEHYIIMNGEVTLEEETDYSELYIEEYETREEANEDLGLSGADEITPEEWEEAQDEIFIYRGGYVDTPFSIEYRPTNINLTNLQKTIFKEI